MYENLKKRNAVSGGEEMLRLRAYEKLQNLVSRSLVEKMGKTYRGLEGIQSASSANQPKPVINPEMSVMRQAVAAVAAAEAAARAAAEAARKEEAKAKPAKVVKEKAAKAASAKAPAKRQVATRGKAAAAKRVAAAPAR